MEEAFTKIVQHIFNNWTGLKLAVEHGMGGPDGKETAIECMNYIVEYCLTESNVNTESIQEALEDILDEEFDTVCEDDSPREIAAVLFKFLQLLKEGNTEQCALEYQKLPTINVDWLNQTKLQHVQLVSKSSDSSSEEESNTSETPMEDDGWTEVRTRRKR